MTPAEIRDQILRQLRAARNEMTLPERVLALEDADAATKKQAAQDLLNTHHKIQELENAELAEIRDKLVQNEKELASAGAKLESTLDGVKTLKAYLTALAKFLEIVARVAPLLI
jgi:hypothetical protein